MKGTIAVCITWFTQGGIRDSISGGKMRSLCMLYMAQKVKDTYMAVVKARLNRTSLTLRMRGGFFGEGASVPATSFRNETLK